MVHGSQGLGIDSALLVTSLPQVYMGQLRNKCVLEIDMAESATGNWTEWILDSDHWFYNSRGPELCGNASGAR